MGMLLNWVIEKMQEVSIIKYISQLECYGNNNNISIAVYPQHSSSRQYMELYILCSFLGWSRCQYRGFHIPNIPGWLGNFGLQTQTEQVFIFVIDSRLKSNRNFSSKGLIQIPGYFHGEIRLYVLHLPQGNFLKGFEDGSFLYQQAKQSAGVDQYVVNPLKYRLKYCP